MMKNLKTVERGIAKIEARRSHLFKLRAPIDKEITTSYKKLEKLKEARDTLLLDEKSTDWDWLLADANHNSKIKYEFREKKLREIGLNSSGYYTETGQASVQIVLTKGDKSSFTKTVAALKLILPYIKPQKDKTKRIAIFEYTCSQYGIYTLVFADETIALEKMAYHRASTVRTFSSLEEAIEYVQEHHWYTGGKEPDEDENDGGD